jgi:hypothetical protein
MVNERTARKAQTVTTPKVELKGLMQTEIQISKAFAGAIGTFSANQAAARGLWFF